MKKVCLVFLVVVCVSATSASEDVQERKKRDIWDDIKNFFSSAGTKISDIAKQIGDFTTENFNKFKESLKDLSKSELEKTYDGLKTHYDSLTDKTSAEALRLDETLTELKKDIEASGSSTCRSSLIAGVLLVLISIFLV